MRVHSLVSLLGLSLATVVLADDDVVHDRGVITGPGVKRREALPVLPARRVKRVDTPGICQHLPSSWSYVGCYKDSTSARALNGPSYCDDFGMAQEKCIEFCDAKGYSVAGLEFGQECFCGYSLGPSGTKAPESDCSMVCTGASDEVCGNGDRLQVFSNGSPAPGAVQKSGNFNYKGCYGDSPSARILESRQNLDGNVRVSDCTNACAANGFTYAGLEFGQECFCGNTLVNNAAKVDDSVCNMACTADHSELCGGAGGLSLYQVPPVGTCGLPGCRFSNNLLRQFYGGVTLQECMGYCVADSTCQDIQFGHDGSTPVCNLLNAAIPDVYAYGYEQDSYCQGYSFYDRTCAV